MVKKGKREKQPTSVFLVPIISTSFLKHFCLTLAPGSSIIQGHYKQHKESTQALVVRSTLFGKQPWSSLMNSSESFAHDNKQFELTQGRKTLMSLFVLFLSFKCHYAVWLRRDPGDKAQGNIFGQTEYKEVFNTLVLLSFQRVNSTCPLYSRH